PGRPEATVDRAGYVFCLLEQFHQRLRRRDIFALASTRWADPRAQLLAGPAWETARGSVLPKFFGRRRGMTLLNLINDQAVGLAAHVVSGTPRDSLNVIDLIYLQDGGRRPEIIISDTGSYSDMVCELMPLLGFDYRPQLADLPDAKLWRINPNTDYGPLNTAARGKVDLGRIRAHWPDLLRLVGSIHTSAVSAHDVLRMLQHGGNPTQLGEALAHYGRIFKTLRVLSYVDQAPYRAQIKGMRNLQEGRHDLARHVFQGGRGDLRQAYHQGMEDQLGALGLVLNCIRASVRGRSDRC
ncbi:MAG: Tn3 family transposase, partial [Pseudonocardiaceae bacterium]